MARDIQLFSAVRNVDRLTDSQLAALEGFVTEGWSLRRAASVLSLDVATIRAWLRDPQFVAAGNELVRAYAASQLVPLGLARIRSELGRPDARLGEITRATKLAAELAGLYGHGAPEAGSYAPAHAAAAPRALDDASADDLRRMADAGRRALEALNARASRDGMP